MIVRHEQYGFTLFELMLVLALIAIMISAAAPSFSSFSRGQEPQYASARFLSLTHWARSQAITDGAKYRIVVDEMAGKWSLEVEKDGAFEESPQAGSSYTLPEGVSIHVTNAESEGGRPVIVFEPTGRTTVCSVTFSGNKNEPIVAECKVAGGFFSIQQQAEVSR